MVKKKEFSSLQMVLTLMLVCAGAALALAFFYELTKGPIARARLEANLRAIREVLPEFANDPYSESISFFMEDEKTTATVYPARDSDGNLVGVAIPASDPKGYDGLLELWFGFDTQGKILQIAKKKVTETPGLGDNILKDKFLVQFLGETLGSKEWSVVADGGDVDAVTAATISSRAATAAAKRAFNIYHAAIKYTDLELKSKDKPKKVVLSVDEALDYVLPPHANNPAEEVLTIDVNAEPVKVYPARDRSGELVGIAASVQKKKAIEGRCVSW